MTWRFKLLGILFSLLLLASLALAIGTDFVTNIQ
jgi:hypothetical protein